jgi:hypothetical protein
VKTHFIKNILHRLQRRGIGAVVVVGCLEMVIYAETPPATPHKPAHANKPVCSAGAICFSGEVSAGEEFHKGLNEALAFDLQLEPDSRSYPVGEWTIAVSPRQAENDCTEFTSVVNEPYRYHNDLNIDTSYAYTAEDEVSASPRKFSFVTNCKDYSTESKRLEIVLGPYNRTKQEANKALAELGSSPLGTGRLWIIDSRISHANDTSDSELGNIEWMQFTVEIRLPHQQPKRAKSVTR